MSMNDKEDFKTFEVGITAGRIVKMEMGISFTGVWIQEELELLSNINLEHNVLITNERARELRIGDIIWIKLEVYE